MEKKYIGVSENRRGGRISYRVRFMYKRNEYAFGYYKTIRETAIAHDLFVLKMGMDRKTNILKKVKNG